MATVFNIPKEIEMKSYLMMLFDGAKVGPGKKVDGKTEGAMIGAFINDDNEPVAVCASDIEFAAFSSCSLTMLPPAAAQDAVKGKKLEPMMHDNLNEVMNIFSRLFMNDNTPHLRFDKCYGLGDTPQAFLDITNGATDNFSMEIEIPRYGKGNVTFLAI